MAYRACRRGGVHAWSTAQETGPCSRPIADVRRHYRAKYAGNATYERMYAHAILGLNSLSSRGRGILRGNAGCPGPQGYAGHRFLLGYSFIASARVNSIP